MCECSCAKMGMRGQMAKPSIAGLLVLLIRYAQSALRGLGLSGLNMEQLSIGTCALLAVHGHGRVLVEPFRSQIWSEIGPPKDLAKLRGVRTYVAISDQVVVGLVVVACCLCA